LLRNAKFEAENAHFETFKNNTVIWSTHMGSCLSENCNFLAAHDAAGATVKARSVWQVIADNLKRFFEFGACFQLCFKLAVSLQHCAP